jgi:hypothetical protein
MSNQSKKIPGLTLTGTNHRWNGLMTVSQIHLALIFVQIFPEHTWIYCPGADFSISLDHGQVARRKAWTEIVKAGAHKLPSIVVHLPYRVGNEEAYYRMQDQGFLNGLAQLLATEQVKAEDIAYDWIKVRNAVDDFIELQFNLANLDDTQPRYDEAVRREGRYE